MLGLVSKIFLDHIEIDYTQSAEQLYRHVARACIEEVRSLDIILYSQLSYSLPDSLSWVPDWRLLQRWNIFADLSLQGTQMPYFRFSDDLSSLTIRGVELATVR
jgi:hypothetical protein